MYFLKVLLLCFVVSGVAIADEIKAMPMCWVSLQNNASMQMKVPCKWESQYSLLWEGESWDINAYESVADGEGYLTLIDKEGYRSVRYFSEWKKGILISSIRLDQNKFYKCLDSSCSQVSIKLKQGTSEYQGTIQFNNDKTDYVFTGHGSISSKNYVYQGDITEGVADGVGKLCIAPEGVNLGTLPPSFDEDDCRFPNLFADGFWDKGNFSSGYLRQIYASGSVYEGGFAEGKLEDWGKFLWADGSLYEGDLNAGRRDGYGRYRYGDGSTYQGEWKGGQKSGVGSLHIKSHAITYTGEWLNNLFHGDGMLTLADKSQLIGEFFQGKPNGECLFVTSNNQLFTTVWQNGKMIFIREVKDKQSTNAFHFSLIPSAHAGILSGLGDMAKSAISSLRAGVAVANEFIVEVREHPEYLGNALLGCMSGGAGGAVAGSAGGAAVGMLAGPAGVAAGAGYGAATGAVSGCLSQGVKAYQARKYQGKSFDLEDAKQAFAEEFSFENFAYGALAGLGRAAAGVAVVVGKAAAVAKKIRILKKAQQLKYRKKLDNIAEQMHRLTKFHRLSLMTWNMKRLSAGVVKNRDRERIRRVFRTNKADIIALQEVGPKSKRLIQKLAKGYKVFSSKYFSVTKEHLYILVSPKLRRQYKIQSVYAPIGMANSDLKMFSLVFKSKKKSRNVWPKSMAVVTAHITYGKNNQQSKSNRKKEISILNSAFLTLPVKYRIPPHHVFILGDFNMEPNEALGFFGNTALRTCAPDKPTTLGSKTYDYLIMSNPILICDARTISFRNIDDLSKQNKTISDHLPVRFNLIGMANKKKRKR